MKRTLYSLTAGVFTSIPALQFARRVEMQEDASGTNIGLAVKFREDNYTQIFEFAPTDEPVVLDNSIAGGNAFGFLQGWPVQTGLNARAADVYAKVSCLAGTTVLRVTEID